MFIRLTFLLFSFSVFAQTEYSLEECTHYLNQESPPVTTFLPMTPPDTFTCPPPINIPVTANLDQNIVITCDSPIVGCHSDQVCNIVGGNTCQAMPATLRVNNGAALFDGDIDESICSIPAVGINLRTVDVDTVTFDTSVNGIIQDCRELLRLYQLQLGRDPDGAGALNPISLPVSTDAN